MDSSESSSEGTSTPPVSTPMPPAVPPVIPQDPISQAQFPRTSIPRADFAPPPSPPPPRAPVPGRSGRSGVGAWKWVALGVSVVLVISLLALFGVLFAKSDLNWTHHLPTQSPGAAELHEVVVRDSPF